MSVDVSIDLSKVEQFIYKEARLLDEKQYEQWEQLWDYEALYWIPANAKDNNPNEKISYIYDNRRRLQTRVRQLLTGEHYVQVPQSRTQHFVTNIAITQASENEIVVEGSQLVVECKYNDMNFWAGHVTYKLVPDQDQFKMKFKKIDLVNLDQPLVSMGFIM